MLSEGYDQRSNLDIPIMLSYTNSQMTSAAQELLSILALLPDGLADADLVQAKLPIPDILACMATLIQTTLAFVGQDQHLKVLVPIQEHILIMHLPETALKLKLWQHFHQILDLWNQFRDLNGPDFIQNLRSILFLNGFYGRAHNTYSLLLLQLSGQMLHWKGHPIFGEYLIELLSTSEYLPALDLNNDITRGTQHFKSKALLEQARWYRDLGLHFQFRKSDLAGAFEYYQTAYSMVGSIGYPTTVGIHALASICNILIYSGKPLNALMHAKTALHAYCLLVWTLACQVSA
ncbi:hypothetical protein C8J57DRAFT_1519698 [Mycena rebaudengoi]|nr:hypothetical protein C8J57DRAFT_1519698 [Mycena rebaudengoi]